jgi:hypothetical protein
MPTFTPEPIVHFYNDRVVVILDVTPTRAASPTDVVWRGLFNRLAADASVEAEAMGNENRTVIYVRLDANVDPTTVAPLLDQVRDRARQADSDRSDRKYADAGVAHAVAEWYRQVALAVPPI